MAIFAIIRQPGSNSERLEKAVETAFADRYDLGSGVWLVAEKSTAQDISKKLEIVPEAVNGSAIVIEAASYFGRANPAVWSWIKANWESVSVG